MPAEQSICLIRHGETERSRARRYNGVEEAALTGYGEQLAARLPPALARSAWQLVLCSPQQRARRTAELAGFPAPEVMAELRECDYGAIEGLTTEEVHARWPDWDFWRDGAPHGESTPDIARRLEPVLDRLRAVQGSCLLFSHSHTLRVLAARWLELPPERAAIFALEPARTSELGTHRGRPVLLTWNVRPHTVEEDQR